MVVKLSGAVRYVVEDDRGLLFIFNANQLVRTYMALTTTREQADTAEQRAAFVKAI